MEAKVYIGIDFDTVRIENSNTMLSTQPERDRLLVVVTTEEKSDNRRFIEDEESELTMNNKLVDLLVR
jgi:hypothetical protein